MNSNIMKMHLFNKMMYDLKRYFSANQFDYYMKMEIIKIITWTPKILNQLYMLTIG